MFAVIDFNRVYPIISDCCRCDSKYSPIAQERRGKKKNSNNKIQQFQTHLHRHKTHKHLPTSFNRMFIEQIFPFENSNEWEIKSVFNKMYEQNKS